MTRSIHKIIPAQKVNMGGIILDQSLPVNGVEQIDPFLLIHHWASVLPGGQKEKEAGVGPHPHRGFSPVSLIFKGAVNHRDSLG
ncbi:MAG TPA: pirin family protein, partial [Flavobacteriales bacterium]|nr:pirin family protein [Flavobacteriales bacterium]